ncbi:hypothetical protein PTSG_03001 [Salpingoeca rosetta]|uniref:YTH domain-containing protein n=1 Tax=Salpingoeca rosetta (strain ATCC 50818 / BSB-021) TaxID=946362 RepID=F2U3Z4_SALR5|nr:uncharacterized protein PTSG_03001 [Salpingoeca rosetta]EGD82338.1 hypothetical protein PTSG_03001 [Salpingoeca rosetta]|eukprot:XP_004996521.1 hypothetical protein PTSG_03001 [Salpingoeca rosetta]
MSDEKGDAATAPAVVAERDGEPQQPQPQQEQEHGGETRESTATDAKDEGEKPENGGGGKEEKEEEPKKNGEEEIPEGVIPDLEALYSEEDAAREFFLTKQDLKKFRVRYRSFRNFSGPFPIRKYVGEDLLEPAYEVQGGKDKFIARRKKLARVWRPDLSNPPKIRYFVLRGTREALTASRATGQWTTTQAQLEPVLARAFKDSERVEFVFSPVDTQYFMCAGLMTTPPTIAETPFPQKAVSFGVFWHPDTRLRFTTIKATLFEDQVDLFAENGRELPPELGALAVASISKCVARDEEWERRQKERKQQLEERRHHHHRGSRSRRSHHHHRRRYDDDHDDFDDDADDRRRSRHRHHRSRRSITPSHHHHRREDEDDADRDRRRHRRRSRSASRAGGSDADERPASDDAREHREDREDRSYPSDEEASERRHRRRHKKKHKKKHKKRRHRDHDDSDGGRNAGNDDDRDRRHRDSGGGGDDGGDDGGGDGRRSDDERSRPEQRGSGDGDGDERQMDVATDTAV